MAHIYMWKRSSFTSKCQSFFKCTCLYAQRYVFLPFTRRIRSISWNLKWSFHFALRDISAFDQCISLWIVHVYHLLNTKSLLARNHCANWCAYQKPTYPASDWKFVFKRRKLRRLASPKAISAFPNLPQLHSMPVTGPWMPCCQACLLAKRALTPIPTWLVQ